MLQLVILTGCGLQQPSLQKLSPLPAEGSCTIAVLPFYNDSAYPLGDLLVYRIFMAEMSRSGEFTISNEGDIRNIYRQMKMYPSRPLDYEQMMIVADRLGVQLIITGNILDMAEENLGSSLNPVISLNLQIYDASSGRRLWTTYHGREGSQYRKVMHFGVINTISALARQVSKEIIELWNREGLQCTDFSE
jgi:TolB-like protein